MRSPYRALPLWAIAVLLLLAAPVATAQTAKKTAPAARPTPPGTGPTIAWSGNKVVLTAAQSSGGVLVKLSDATQGVSLDKSCERPWPETTCIEWNLATPLPVGWWHGTVDFSVREGEDKGYTNAQLGVVLRSPQKPLANMLNNFNKGPLGTSSEKFEFWTYISAPADGVHIQDVYARLWLYKRTWPILQVTLEHAEPTALTTNDSITLELPVQKDGSVALPMALPPGLWCLTAAMKKEGMAICQGKDGRNVEGAFTFDKWRKPSPVRVYLESPLQKITFKTSEMFKLVSLENCIIRSAESITTDGRLITVVDPAKSQSGDLEMIGANLTGAAPSLPILPGGRQTAVLTLWDDGALTDLRLAEILHRLGYHPTFFWL